MDRPAETKQGANLRDYLAAERTFLAWIRTGIALMGCGFVVARFGLFLGFAQKPLVFHIFMCNWPFCTKNPFPVSCLCCDTGYVTLREIL
jgi:hypothetical protein